jgi:hypothetical protein
MYDKDRIAHFFAFYNNISAILTFMQKTQMEIEARQTPIIITKQLAENKTLLQAVAKKITDQRPLFAVTIGRGNNFRSTISTYNLWLRIGS